MEPMSWGRGLLGAWLAFAAATGGACAPYRPPFTQARVTPGANARDDQQATLVFLWPVTSCDPGGYYTLATADGRFVGNVSRGTQLRVAMPAGAHTIVAWNELQEQAGGAVAKSAVSVLRARVSAGRTYYVRMAFGEWDSHGPREAYAGRVGGTGSRWVCMAPGLSMTSAMVVLSPGSPSWNELPGWTGQLEAIVPDVAAGQAWLDGNRDVLQYHRAIGEGRFEGLNPLGRRLATLETDDGVVTSR
jgi:hypothetical protein